MKLGTARQRQPIYWGEKRWIIQGLACLYLPQCVWWPVFLAAGFWKSWLYVLAMPLALPIMTALHFGLSHDIVPLWIQGITVMLLFLGVCWLGALAGRTWAFAAGAVIAAESCLSGMIGISLELKSHWTGIGWPSVAIAVVLLTWLIGCGVKGWRFR
jgi:hypothetical protein